MDSYAIGVQIMLASNLPQMLNTISTRMLGLHTTVGQVNNQFSRMAQVIGGVGAALAGGAIIKGMASIVEHGAKINHEFELMKNQSFDITEINKSMTAAMQVSSIVQQTTVAENLKHIRELRYAFGETQDATKYLEIVSKANVVANSYSEKFGISGMKDQVFDLVKGEEMKGLTASPSDFTSMMDVWVKAMVASGGKVTAANFLGTMKYARTAGLMWDETFMGQFLPRLMQEYSTGGSGGSGGPGNALMSAYQAIVSGKMTKVAGEQFEAMGLAHSEHIKGSSSAHITGMKGRDLFMSNPYEWVQSVLMPALAAHGVKSEFGVTQQLTQMFSNRTAADVVTKMALQGRFMEGENSPFEKDAKLARMAQGIVPAYAELNKGDWQTNMVAFHKQFENLLEMFGAPIVRQATDMLRGINDSMAGVAKWAGEHPEGVRLAMEAAAVVGGALVVGGITAVLGGIAALSPVAAGIGAAAGAIGALAALNWNALSGGISSLIDGFKGLFSHSGAGGSTGTPGGEGTTFTPMRFNAVPPAGRDHFVQVNSVLNMDGRRVGEGVTQHIADRGTLPIEGSAHFDPTWLAPATDVSYA